MASVYKRKNSRGVEDEFYTMQIKVHGHKKITRSTGKTNKKEAQAVADKEEAALKVKVNAATNDKILLSECIDSYFDERWHECVTGKQRRAMARVFITLLGDIYIQDINTKMIREAVAEIRKKGLRPASVNGHITSLQSVMRFANKVSPFQMPFFELSKKVRARERFYSHEEEFAIIEYFKSLGQTEMVDLAGILIDTGFRVSEVLNIGKYDKEGDLISSFDLKTGMVTTFKNKTDKPRSVPMTIRVREILSSRGSVPFKGLTYIQASHNWHGFTYKGVVRIVGVRAALNLGRDAVIHTCRHTTASRLVQSGVPLLVVKEWMGHKRIISTMRYAHLCPTSLSGALTSLEAHNSHMDAPPL